MATKKENQQIKELTEQVKRLSEEVAALRLAPQIQLVPYYVPQPIWPQPQHPLWSPYEITFGAGGTSQTLELNG